MRSGGGGPGEGVGEAGDDAGELIGVVLAMPSSSLARTPLIVVWSCLALCSSMAMLMR